MFRKKTGVLYWALVRFLKLWREFQQVHLFHSLLNSLCCRCLAQLTGYTGIKYTNAAFASAMLNLIPGFTFILAIIFRCFYSLPICHINHFYRLMTMRFFFKIWMIIVADVSCSSFYTELELSQTELSLMQEFRLGSYGLHSSIFCFSLLGNVNGGRLNLGYALRGLNLWTMNNFNEKTLLKL